MARGFQMNGGDLSDEIKAALNCVENRLGALIGCIRDQSGQFSECDF